MAITTILPNSTENVAGWATTGSVAHHTVLSDGSDATVAANNAVGNATIGHAMQLGFPTVTLPANAVIKRVTPRVRVSQAAGAQRLTFRVYVRNPAAGGFMYQSPSVTIRSVATIANYDGPASAPWLASSDPAHPEWTPQYIASNLHLSVDTNADLVYTNAGDDQRVAAVSLEVEYDEQPVVSGLVFSPTDAPVRTSRPTLTWSTTDPEGSAQAGRRVVVWNATDAADANCPKVLSTSFVATNGTTRTAVAYTGTAADPREQTSASSWTPAVDLQNASYTAFVGAADFVGNQVRWATNAGTGQLNFTVNVDPPVVPTLVTPTWDAVNDRMNLTVSTKNNELTTDASDQETGDVTSWVANFNAAGGVSVVATPTAFAGTQSRRWISGGVGATDSSVATGQFYPCLAGSVKSYRVRVRSSAASRSFNLQVLHYDASGTPVGSTTISSNVTGNNTGWTLLPLLNVTVPAGATQFKLFVNAVATAASESNYLDTAGAYPGATIAADTRGGLVPSQRVVIERSTDGGVTYWALPQCSTLAGGVLMDGSTNQQLVTFDLANRANTPARYRARTGHTDGQFAYSSAYSAVGGPVTPVIDTWNLRDPTDAATSMVGVQIGGDFQGTSTEEMAVYDIQGFPYPGMVSSGVVKTKHWGSVPLVFKSQAAYDQLVALRARTSIMILQTDMDGVAYWVRFGPEQPDTLPVSSSRRVAGTRPRFVTVDLYQSTGPTGQPSFFPP